MGKWMRFGLVTFAVGAAVPLSAQQQWEPQVGIQAGFLAQSVSGQTLSAWNLPGTSLTGSGFPLPSSLYGIIPVDGRWAVEIGAGLTDANIGGGQYSTLTLAPRLDAALSPHLYAAAGPTMSAMRLGGASLTQWGGAAAVGYRIKVGRHLTARAEAYFEHRFSAASNSMPESDLYGIQLGIAAVLGEPSEGNRGPARSPATDRLWTPALALSAGYTNVYVPGQGGVSIFTLPGAGSASTLAFSVVIPGPAGVSAIVPVSDRIALEPAVDVHHVSPAGGGPSFTIYKVSARAAYAFNRHLYAAIGVGNSGSSSSSTSTNEWGGLAAVGVRFPLVAGVSGRLEYEYATWQGDGNNAPTVQTNSLMFGVIAPID